MQAMEISSGNFLEIKDTKTNTNCLRSALVGVEAIFVFCFDYSVGLHIRIWFFGVHGSLW